jgi:hypothetical protein
VSGLVLADRHVASFVDRDVGTLEDRIAEQRVVNVVRLSPSLLLERRCPLDPADRDDRAQEPGELGVLGPVRLPEQHRLLRVEP